MRSVDAVEGAFERASLHGHERCRVLRAEDRRAVAVCLDCGAGLYIGWSGEATFMEGEVFEVDCAAPGSDRG